MYARGGRPGLSSGIRMAIITDLRFVSSELQLHSHDGKQYHSQPFIDATVDTVMEEWGLCKATVDPG